MEFIDPENELNIRDRNWRITTKHRVSPPQFLTESASVNDSLIASGCYVSGEVNHSIVSTDAQIGEEAKIIDSVIMPGARIGKNAHVYKAIIGENAVVGDNAEISGGDKVEVVGNGEVIGVCSDED